MAKGQIMVGREDIFKYGHDIRPGRFMSGSAIDQWMTGKTREHSGRKVKPSHTVPPEALRGMG